MAQEPTTKIARARRSQDMLGGRSPVLLTPLALGLPILAASSASAADGAAYWVFLDAKVDTEVRRVTEMTGAKPVVVALAVDGQEDMKTFFDQFDIWIGSLVKAFAELEG